MADRPPFSIVIVVWNQLCYTKLAIESMLKYTRLPLELVIVDNGSRPEVKAYVDSLRASVLSRGKTDICYIRNEQNVGPIRALNQGVAAATGAVIVAIHNDVIIDEDGWLEKVQAVLGQDAAIGLAGLAGRQEIYKTGSVNEETLKHGLHNEDLNEPMKEDVADVAVLDGLCLILTRRVLASIRGFDETFGYMHCYDLDISLQSIEAGFRNVAIKIGAIHIGNGGMTRKLRAYKELVGDDYGLLKRNGRILARKWRHVLPLTVRMVEK